jgi:hypothetical protein
VLAHRTESTVDVRLKEIRGEIFTAIDQMVFRVGELLYEAKMLRPRTFQAWVESALPFGYDRAYRLIAIHLAYRELPEAVRNRLPRPWQALFALRHLAADGRIVAEVNSGAIHPELTVREALALKPGPRHSDADLLVGRLLGHDPSSLDPVVRDDLVAWLAETP